MNSTHGTAVDPSSSARACALALSAIILCGTWTPLVMGQNGLEQELQGRAALTIVGEVGKVYSIEHVTDLTEPVEGDWRLLEFLQLPASPYLWADKSAPVTGKRFYRTVAVAPTNMVFIPAGAFRMGSPEDEVDRESFEGPQTDVIISRGFWMGKYQVTQADYLEVMENNPSLNDGLPGQNALNHPVERVSWNDAVAYCAALTDQKRSAGQIPSGSVYRLPTEAEWEYACRAWTSTRFSYGDDPGYTNLANYAWYHLNNDYAETHPAGLKLPNPWGLYDMHGNVWEWCQDWWADSLRGESQVDPQGPATGTYRVIRGGISDVRSGNPRVCRSALRAGDSPSNNTLSLIGFRVVLVPAQP